MDINVHFERMDHEFGERADSSLILHGYRLDGNGKDGSQSIKMKCKFQSQKSADYIYEENSSITFVEFSDLARQYHAAIGDRDAIKEINLGSLNCPHPVALKKKLMAAQINNIHTEAITKFEHSFNLLESIRKAFNNAPKYFDTKPKAVLVYAPISPADQPCRKAEVARIMSTLRSKILTGVTPDRFSNIRVEQLDKFCHPTA